LAVNLRPILFLVQGIFFNIRVFKRIYTFASEWMKICHQREDKAVLLKKDIKILKVQMWKH